MLGKDEVLEAKRERGKLGFKSTSTLSFLTLTFTGSTARSDRLVTSLGSVSRRRNFDVAEDDERDREGELGPFSISLAARLRDFCKTNQRQYIFQSKEC